MGEYNECNCYTCKQLGAIQAQIINADSLIGDLYTQTTIDSRIIMRPINARLNELNIEFDTTGMIPVADNQYY